VGGGAGRRRGTADSTTCAAARSGCGQQERSERNEKRDPECLRSCVLLRSWLHRTEPYSDNRLLQVARGQPVRAHGPTSGTNRTAFKQSFRALSGSSFRSNCSSGMRQAERDYGNQVAECLWAPSARPSVRNKRLHSPHSLRVPRKCEQRRGDHGSGAGAWSLRNVL